MLQHGSRWLKIVALENYCPQLQTSNFKLLKSPCASWFLKTVDLSLAQQKQQKQQSSRNHFGSIIVTRGITPNRPSHEKEKIPKWCRPQMQSAHQY
jgi:hypothetical protein